MSHLVAGTVINIIGAAAVVVLGIFVLSIKPRRSASVWFGLFGIGFGLYFMLNNATGFLLVGSEYGHGGVASEGQRTITSALQVVFQLVTLAGIGGMAFTFPHPLKRADRPAIVAAAGLTLALAGATLGLGRTDFSATESTLLLAIRHTWQALEAVRFGALFGFLLLLGIRYLRSQDPGFRRLTALTAAGLTFYCGYVAGYGRYASSDAGIMQSSGPMAVLAWAYFVVAIGLIGLWLVGMRGPEPRVARALAWLTGATILAGMILDSWSSAYAGGGGGASRLLMAAVLAYAVVKHQLLGIDVKLRFAISKSTIAAIFIAVFFIASEAAQQFFGDRTGSTYFGIAIAGTLVFAMAPIQRAAEKLAAKAVPVSLPTPVAVLAEAYLPSNSTREASYVDAIRWALRDKHLTRTEEAKLHGLAENLGIGNRRAHELMTQVETESAEAKGRRRHA